MRQKKIKFFSFFFLVLLLFSCSSNSVKEVSTQQKEIEYYTCSMHPKIHEAQMGTCPICHMNLIPVYKE